jgi:hypothetical protein
MGFDVDFRWIRSLSIVYCLRYHQSLNITWSNYKAYTELQNLVCPL